ncbi:RNA 2',3'-cyclic phosphodiesterase [Ruania halotolerans]|uniref:RNA 2',3'-cyclic phosphodiesterase n=1 Tax=Ruania halotolerans TaxID=2897773 RepID=UPI001E5F0457|nr:RNA 2',3'-cyclic phosphodiesterase [Ruania halotolerans]UFU05092.1 RNA 2',3'-cyclic phosphodiesterase [Ruania halotolerans]
MRLFAALWPPPEVLDHLNGALAAVLEPSPSGGPPTLRRTPQENLHVTVAFYGTVPDGAASDVRASLAEEAAGAAPVYLHLAGSGSFGDRSLWVGVGGEVAALTDLMQACARAPYVAAEDGPPARSPRPHLTVARASRRGTPERRGRRRREHAAEEPSAVRVAARALAVYRGPDWMAEEITLVASHLGEGAGGAPRYEVIDTLELGH